MRWTVVVAALCIAQGAYSQDFFGNLVKGTSDLFNGFFDGISGKPKQPTDVCLKDGVEDFKNSQNKFYEDLFAKVAARSNNHFVFSPYNIWLTLAALAEGAEPSQQTKLFTSLLFPKEKCLRDKFYNIALRVEQPSQDINLQTVRSLIVDESLLINPDWSKRVQNIGLIDVQSAPIQSDPEGTSEKIQEILSLQSNYEIQGSSIVLDTLDYQGLWTTAFPDANVEQTPFYDDSGNQIGTIEVMRMKKKVRLAIVPFMNTKVLELPVGVGGRYTMLIAVGTQDNMIESAIQVFMGSILDILNAMQLSLVPVDIAVPRFSMSSAFDMRPALEDIGITQFWNDPSATSFATHPAAMPNAFLQQVSVKIDKNGVSPLPPPADNIISGFFDLAQNTASDMASVMGYKFEANRPFMYALFDTETRTCVFAGAYSQPELFV